MYAVQFQIQTCYQKNLNRMYGTYELPLTKKFLNFLEKATAPIAPKWPLPVPRQLLLSISQSFTLNNKKGEIFSNQGLHTFYTLIQIEITEKKSCNLLYCLCFPSPRVYALSQQHNCQGIQQFRCDLITQTHMTLLQHHTPSPVKNFKLIHEEKNRYSDLSYR